MLRMASLTGNCVRVGGCDLKWCTVQYPVELPHLGHVYRSGYVMDMKFKEMWEGTLVLAAILSAKKFQKRGEKRAPLAP